jgi:hypothetical protein
MNLRRIKPMIFIACGMMATSISVATTAHAATFTPTTSQRSAATAVGCNYWTADLGYRYYEADKDTSIDWTARSGATSGSAVVLEPVSGSSLVDCFKVQGGFAGGHVAFILASSDLCLNIAGNSHKVGAWAILYPCTYPSNELFNVISANTGDGGVQIQSASSLLCLDLSNGYNRGSILEQKDCSYGDIYQSWHVTS